MDSLLPKGYETDKWYSKNDPFMDTTNGYWYFRFIRYKDQGECCALRFDYLTYGPFPSFEKAKIVQDNFRNNIEFVESDWEAGNRDRDSYEETTGDSSPASIVSNIQSG